VTESGIAAPPQGPPLIDVARQRRRLFVMVGIDLVCLLVAMGALVGDMGFHIHWMMWVFLGALLAGFSAQGWLIMGLRKG
jgi:hypothetical protein